MSSNPQPAPPDDGDPDLGAVLAAEVEVLAILRILRHDLGLTQEDVAKATGASARSVHNWERDGGIRQSFEDRIRDLAYVVGELSSLLTPRGVDQWLHARNRQFDGERPLEVLGGPDRQAVIDAVHSLTGGTTGG